MNSRERILSALKGQAVDRVPWCPFLAYWFESQPEARQERGQISFFREIGADALLRGFGCAFASSDVLGLEEKNYNVHDDLPGCTITRQSRDGRRLIEYETRVGRLSTVQTYSPSGDTWFVTGHPVKEKEDYKILRYIVERMKISPAYAEVDREIDELGLDGLSAPLISPFKKTPFQSLVEHFVGTEKLIYDLYDFPSIMEETLAVMREKALEAVRISVESRAEAFISWEDSSTTNISPALFERYVVPDINGWGRIVHGAGKLLIHHACGHIRDLLPIMALTEADAIESITPPPTGNVGIGEARALLGRTKALIGGLDPVRFLTLQGSDLDAYVEETLDAAGERGFILANSDSCPPGVEEEKFSRITKLVGARRGPRPAGDRRAASADDYGN